MTTEITKLLGIKYPIIQGGMAWVAESTLASAVSNAGGVGLIAGGSAPADVIRQQIRRAKELTAKPFGVNIMLMSPFADDLAQLCIDEKIAVVTTGAGNPGKYIEAWKNANIKVIPVVPSVALAIRMERAGADALICEGQEAGGHIGEQTTMCLVPQVVDAVNVPVIAAGGIADGRGFAAAIMLGAQGVQIGTRFLCANECQICEAYKDKVIKAKDTDTVVTGRFTGHPVRVLKNKFSRNLLKLEKESPSIEEFEKQGTGSLRIAVQDGDDITSSFMAGQIAGMVNKKESCDEIIKEIIFTAKGLLTDVKILRGVSFE
ncbi:MAG: enoyl-[acyl-carrier-protein] reductase FabK [Oscillospiraceae bacterium]